MSAIDDYARSVFESAKWFLQQAKDSNEERFRQGHLRAALLSGSSFLECQVYQISDHFAGSSAFEIQERALMAERAIELRSGKFRLSTRTQYSRLEDKIEFLMTRFMADPAYDNRPWKAPLANALQRRNSIAHPKGELALTVIDVSRDLQAILEAASDLFEVIFKKPLPYKSHGLTPKS
jgi:hypothetical protein